MRLADVPRNDVPAALAYVRERRRAGTLRRADVAILLRSQDDSTALLRALADESDASSMHDAAQ